MNQRDVSAGYLRTLGRGCSRGRYFTADDDATKPNVVVINQALARRYFPNEDPIGQRIGDTRSRPHRSTRSSASSTTSGKAQLDQEIWPAVYYPFNQSADTRFSLVVRTAQAPTVGPARRRGRAPAHRPRSRRPWTRS